MPSMQTIALFALIGAWAAFWIYWLVSWSKVKPTVERQSTSSRLMVVVPVALGFVFLSSPIGRSIFPGTTLIYILSTVLSVVGIATAIWARRTLGENWSSNVTFKEGHELIQHGPYRLVRHPIYTGFLSMLLAWAVFRDDPRGFLGVAFATLGFWYKLRQEEELMTRHFPSYAAYKARVKALVPWVL